MIQKKRSWYRVAFMLAVVGVSSVEALFERAHVADIVEKGEWEQAHQLMNTLLVDNPNDASLLYDASVIAYRMKQYQLSQEYATRAAQMAPEGSDLWKQATFNAGNAAVMQKKLPEALQLYESILSKDPHHERALHNSEIVRAMLKKEEEKQQKKDEQKKKDQDKKDNKKNDPLKNDQNNDQKNDDQQDGDQNQQGNQNNQKGGGGKDQQQGSGGDGGDDDSQDNDDQQGNKQKSSSKNKKRGKSKQNDDAGEQDSDDGDEDESSSGQKKSSKQSPQKRNNQKKSDQRESGDEGDGGEESSEREDDKTKNGGLSKKPDPLHQKKQDKKDQRGNAQEGDDDREAQDAQNAKNEQKQGNKNKPLDQKSNQVAHKDSEKNRNEHQKSSGKKGSIGSNGTQDAAILQDDGNEIDEGAGDWVELAMRERDKADQAATKRFMKMLTYTQGGPRDNKHNW